MYCLKIVSFSRSEHFYFHQMRNALARASALAKTNVCWLRKDGVFESEHQYPFDDWGVTVVLVIEEIVCEDDAEDASA